MKVKTTDASPPLIDQMTKTTDKISLSHYFGVLLLLLLLPLAVNAQEPLKPLFVFPQQDMIAGERIELFAYFLNESSTILQFEPPTSLHLQLTDSSGASRLVVAQAIDAAQITELSPGRFYRQEYRLILPLDFEATLQVRLAEGGTTATLIDVLPAPHLTATINRDELPDVSYQSLKDLESLYQSYVADLFTYEPIYFLVGTDPAKSKFQLSFKYRLLNRNGSLSSKYPWLSGLYFAYTQTSFWDLDSDSIPFSDTSYKPQIMFQTDNLSRFDTMAGFFVRTGLTHKSNGRDGSGSRSTNYFYIKPMGVFYHQASRLGVMISPKFLVYVNNNNDTNRDLPDYRGYLGLETRVGKAHSLMLTTNLRFARKGTSVQTDLTYPIDRLLGNNLNVYLHLQYSNSLAESLIDYQKRTEVLRLGLSFFR